MLLHDSDRALLAGESGEAAALAMRILVQMADVLGAERFLDITSCHVDGCLFHGDSGLDFALRLVEGGAKVRVPTTLNVGAMDQVAPTNFHGSAELGRKARDLMDAYEEMGCQPIWTCAPYQARHRPALGDQVAWAESNAIVFVNSVLGARTNRYGDFIDICAGITGRAPAYGLHLSENRIGEWLFDLRQLPARLLREPAYAPVIGYFVGAACGTAVPVLLGLPTDVDEDYLKALGAAAASSGAVALFHAVGVTPEAPTLEAAFGGRAPSTTTVVDREAVGQAATKLSTVADGPIEAVALGSPHFSIREFEALLPLLEAWPPSDAVEFVVCTHRLVLAELESRGWFARLLDLGVRLVADTCVVVTPILRSKRGPLMTNSGKFAHYTPGNTGLAVIYGSLEECVRSAAQGVVWRDPELW